MAIVRLYDNTSENNAIPKAITLVGKKEGVQIPPNTSLTNPTFTLSGPLDIKAVNYCHIDLFNRFYFIDDITLLSADLWKISCRIDVLQSFKDELLGQNFLVSRQEYKKNDMLVDDKIISRVGTNITKKVLGNVGNEITYVLTVTGGADNGNS